MYFRFPDRSMFWMRHREQRLVLLHGPFICMSGLFSKAATGFNPAELRISYLAFCLKTRCSVPFLSSLPVLRVMCFVDMVCSCWHGPSWTM